MDAILSLGVTGLVDRVLESKQTSDPATNEFDAAELKSLDRHQARDLLLLAACYDQSTSETKRGRWHRLRRKLRYRAWLSQWDLALGLVGTATLSA